MITRDKITGQLASLAKQRQETLEKLATINGAIEIAKYFLTLASDETVTDFPRGVTAAVIDAEPSDTEATG